jgi:hypothetical protein
LAAIAWLLKSALAAWIAKDAEKFKATLKADADREIESLKHSLQMIATEHQVRFSKMHERRAEVIEDLYKKLTHLYLDGQRFVLTSENNPSGYKENEFKNLREKISDVFVLIEEHRILLPTTVCSLLDQYVGQLGSVVYVAGVFGRIQNANEQTTQQSNDAFTKAYKDFETDIPAARKALEDEFRKMLGSDAG